MSRKFRNIKKIEVGKAIRENKSAQENLYIGIHCVDEKGPASLLIFEKTQFSCTSTTDFIKNLASLAGNLAARVTPNTVLIVNELSNEEASIVVRAWQRIQR